MNEDQGNKEHRLSLPGGSSTKANTGHVASRTVMDADPVADPSCAPMCAKGRWLQFHLPGVPVVPDQHHHRLHSIILSLPRNPIAHSRSRLTATLIGVSVRGYVANMAQLRHDVMT